MKIVGRDLHARQQTLAIMDTGTGEFTEKTLLHDENTVRAFYAGLESPVLVGIEATGAMQWFLELLEELGIEYRVDIQQRFEPKKPGGRSTTGETQVCCCCSARIASQRFGCPRANSETCEPCCGTVISGCGCEVECSTRYRESHSITGCDKVVASGKGKDNSHCRPYLCHRTPPNGEMSCSICTSNYRSGPRNSIKRSKVKPDKGHKHAGS
jgi:hypothetical protein